MFYLHYVLQYVIINHQVIDSESLGIT